MLKHFAAHVERQVVGIDDSAHKAEVGRQNLQFLVGDEHALDIEFYALFARGNVKVCRHVRGNVQERAVFDSAFGLCVDPEQGILFVAGEGFIEVDVVLVRELWLWAAP